MLLSELARGQAGVVEFVEGQGSVRRHLLDMGLTPNAVVTLQKTAPMGDPIQVTVRGYELTLRLNEANNVRVRALDAAEDAAAVGAPSATNASAADNASATGSTPATAHREPVPHPGLGEFGPAEEAYRALHVARFDEAPGRIDFCPASEHEHDPLGAVTRCIHATGHIIEPYADQAKIPTHFAATKMVEGDELIARKLDLPESAISSIRELTASMQADAGMDAEAALANMRFAFLFPISPFPAALRLPAIPRAPRECGLLPAR